MSVSPSTPNDSHLLGSIVSALSTHRIWVLSALIVATLLIVSTPQGISTIQFVIAALSGTAPFLLASILIAAYVGASGADHLIAKAFAGAPILVVLMASLVGALSPFCSCGVIPLVAALLAMGVPLSAVMAFWLASPVMDPSMFALTASVMGWEFAVAKTLAAIGLGLFGGYVTLAMMRAGMFTNPLRDGIGNGGCGASKIREPKPVVWAFWKESDRVTKFRKEAFSTTMFLLKWLTFAFILESLMLAYVPGEVIAQSIGGTGIGTIGLATVVGVPAYLNGYAAVPLISGLMQQGMGSGAAMAFLIAGGVSSLPAAIAVWALARPPVFMLYIGFALVGSFAAGLMFQAWVG
jgi:uncharacterized membrane protein YraQ (UPF0718 family)